MNKKTILIIIPIYNEKKSVVADLIKELKENDYSNICIIDDGSEEVMDIFDKNITVFRHCMNRGKGAAVRTAMTYAIRKKYDTIVTIDGDGQHDVKDIEKLINEINTGKQVVLGVRLDDPKDMPKHKIVANHISNLVTWLFFGVYVRDSQSGLRAYDVKILKKMKLVSDRYEFDSEIIREIGRLKLKFSEIPINVRYTEYSMNKRNKQTVIGGVKMIINFFRIM